jgi:hypothetical protein
VLLQVPASFAGGWFNSTFKVSPTMWEVRQQRQQEFDVAWNGTVRVFWQKFALEDAIGSHACSLGANTRVTNGIPLGRPLFLPVYTVNCVQTLKEGA